MHSVEQRHRQAADFADNRLKQDPVNVRVIETDLDDLVAVQGQSLGRIQRSDSPDYVARRNHGQLAEVLAGAQNPQGGSVTERSGGSDRHVTRSIR